MDTLALSHELVLCGYFLDNDNMGLIKLKCENSKLSNRDIMKKMDAEL